jgi:hypothetical protein
MLVTLLMTLAIQTPPQDGLVLTAPSRTAETEVQLRLREAMAYDGPLPRGAPEEDFPLVAWCDALVTGHVQLGETLSNRDPLDLEIMRLGRLEAADFRTALAEASPRQTPQLRAAAADAAAAAAAMWVPLMAQTDEAARSQAFGLFFGLPGRCEHAARRIRAGITSKPASLQPDGQPSQAGP